MRMPKSQPQCASGGLRSLSLLLPLPLREGLFEVVVLFMRDLPGVVTATHGRPMHHGALTSALANRRPCTWLPEGSGESRSIARRW
jgi:hypothetical protein